jgi:peptidoglycan/xylan/chitin deacetylase (PgdA/CDA1 family)
MQPGKPLITFTFDDFPRSALHTGGGILGHYGAAGTYYIALGLMSQVGPTGEIFRHEDLHLLSAQGHELGCHTFHHCPAWETSAREYEASVVLNSATLRTLAPAARMETHSYPISYPRPSSKRRISDRFRACRGGGQAINYGIVDLNYLNSFFLEQSSDNFDAIERMIAANAAIGGWLVFSTHDVDQNPTRFGCTPRFFEKVVQRSIHSGATVVSMSAALESLSVRSLQ